MSKYVNDVIYSFHHLLIYSFLDDKHTN